MQRCLGNALKLLSMQHTPLNQPKKIKKRHLPARPLVSFTALHWKRLTLADVSFQRLDCFIKKRYLFHLIYVSRSCSRSIFFMLQSQRNVLTK